MTTRRRFLGWAGASAFLSRSAAAQAPARAVRLGYLAGSAEVASFSALEKGMRELGYVEGKNLVWERRYAGGDYQRLPALAAELVRLKLDLIVVGGGTATAAATKATTDTPLVMVLSADPVASGFVKSMARPGGNVTGVTGTAGETGSKRLEVLLEMDPTARRIAYLFNPGNPTITESAINKVADAFKRERNVELIRFAARSATEIERAFPEMKRRHVEGLTLPPDSLLSQQHAQIARLAIANNLPSVGGLLAYATAGGLAGYGANYDTLYHQAAAYVDKILRGAKPGDLAVARGDIIELWINQRTAGLLGRTIPQALLLRANTVIQ